MAVKSVCLLHCCSYLLLASVVIGITPVIFPGKLTSDCSLGDSMEDEQFMETLKQIQQQQYYIFILKYTQKHPLLCVHTFKKPKFLMHVHTHTHARTQARTHTHNTHARTHTCV